MSSRDLAWASWASAMTSPSGDSGVVAPRPGRSPEMWPTGWAAIGAASSFQSEISRVMSLAFGWVRVTTWLAEETLVRTMSLVFRS